MAVRKAFTTASPVTPGALMATLNRLDSVANPL